MLRCVTAAVAALIAAAPAQAQRPFPPTALRGEIVFTQWPEATLNGEPARLAPGARVHGPNNLLRTPASLAGQRALVHYTREVGTGLLQQVWLLTPEELARKPWPSSDAEAKTWSFDWAAQTWTRR